MDPASALARVQEQVAAACDRARRDQATVRILPVSKSVDADRLRAAIDAGLTTFGENRVQEAEDKASALPAASWVLIGRLQSNKAARAVAVFDEIQSVDSTDLARRLDRLTREAGRPALPVYLQVNTDLDEAKGGFEPEVVERELAGILELRSLEVRGLMTVGRLVDRPEDARPTFRRLRELSERMRAIDGRLGAGLSMGMSHDFEVAVEEGATVVRVGSAIFGQRRAG